MSMKITTIPVSVLGDDYDFQRFLENSTKFAPKSPEAIMARKHLGAIIDRLRLLCGVSISEYFDLQNALTNYSGELIREGAARGARLAFRLMVSVT